MANEKVEVKEMHKRKSQSSNNNNNNNNNNKKNKNKNKKKKKKGQGGSKKVSRSHGLLKHPQRQGTRASWKRHFSLLLNWEGQL